MSQNPSYSAPLPQRVSQAPRPGSGRRRCGGSAFFEALPYLYFLHGAILWAAFPEPLNVLLAIPLLGAGTICLGVRLRQRRHCREDSEV